MICHDKPGRIDKKSRARPYLRADGEDRVLELVEKRSQITGNSSGRGYPIRRSVFGLCIVVRQNNFLLQSFEVRLDAPGIFLAAELDRLRSRENGVAFCEINLSRAVEPRFNFLFGATCGIFDFDD